MSSTIGWAWAHHKKQYEKHFNEPSPKWINEYALYDRLRLVKFACNLKWRLPQDVLLDHNTNSKNVK